MKLYDLEKKLLTDFADYRNNDRALIWAVWRAEGYVTREGFTDQLSRTNFMVATSPESICRCRRKLQEEFPELQATDRVRCLRSKKAKEKGTFVYRETLPPTF